MGVCRLIKVQSGDEASIAPVFEAIVGEFPDVAAGSYPVASPEHGPVVVISFESKDSAQLDRAVERYREVLGEQGGGGEQILSVLRDTDTLV